MISKLVLNLFYYCRKEWVFGDTSKMTDEPAGAPTTTVNKFAVNFSLQATTDSFVSSGIEE